MHYREGTGENGASVLTVERKPEHPPIGRFSAAKVTGVSRVSADCAA